MIEKIVLTNFQCHEKLVLNLDPGINVIVGESDRGKSAIVRALYWVSQNSPGGDSFIHWDAEECSVFIKANKSKIKKIKGKKQNTYLVDDQEFNAFGQNVPEEVTQALKLYPINFQRQLDQPYWFMETPGALTKKLNEMINLAQIDDVMASAAKKTKQSKTILANDEQRLKEATAELESNAWIPEFVEAGEKVLKLEKQIKDKQDSSNDLATTILSIKEKRKAKRELSNKYKELLILEEEAASCIKLSTKASKLSSLINEIRLTKTKIKKIPDFSNVEKLRSEGDYISENRSSLDFLVTQLKLAKEKAWQTKELHDDYQKELKKALKEHPVCPLCLTPTTKV